MSDKKASINEEVELLPDEFRPSVEACVAALEKFAAERRPVVLHNWRYGMASFTEALELGRTVRAEGTLIPIMQFDAEYFKKLYVTVPPDQEQAFRVGRPIVVWPIVNDNRPRHPQNRPDDTTPVRDAKTALEVSAFGRLASQITVELTRNSRAKQITRSGAHDRSVEKLAAGTWRGGADPMNDGKLGRFQGLIDRGRRKIAALLGFQRPRDASKHFAEQTLSRLEAGVSVDVIEAENLEVVGAFSGHEEQAVKRETAMYRWARNVEKKRPIDLADLRDIGNAHADRQNAYELMRVAIEGSLNPSEVQGHLLTMTDAFETGRKIGLFLRGNSITFTPENAEQVCIAIETVRRGTPGNEMDVAYHYLADALTRGPDPLAWWPLSQRVMASGVSATVYISKKAT